jgi:hypothetical protein
MLPLGDYRVSAMTLSSALLVPSRNWDAFPQKVSRENAGT